MSISDKEILEKFKNGMSSSKIRKQFHVHYRRIVKIIDLNNLDRNLNNTKIDLDEKLICELYLSKQYTLSALKEKFFLKSESSIKRILKHNNISINFKGYNRSSPPKIDINLDLIKELYYNKNQSSEEIGNLLNVSSWTILDRLKNNNLPILSQGRGHKFIGRGLNKISKVNDYFLDELNESSAWFLGWVLSDGAVINNNIIFSLASKDIDVLEKMKKLLSFKGKIYSYNIILKGKSYPQLRINITSNRLSQKLKDIGIISPKSLNEKFPIYISSSNNELIIKRFIQGVFEGDGSFINSNNYHCFQIVGTKELLLDIQQYLIKYVNVSFNKLTQNIKNKNHYALRYSGLNQSYNIMNWLYSDVDINLVLNRKYNLYLVEKGKI